LNIGRAGTGPQAETPEILLYGRNREGDSRRGQKIVENLDHPNSRGVGHHWRFFRAGGFDQATLETGAELAALGQLDLKLWVALASPASGLEIDTATLASIDTDKDGRIRANELIAAVQWACGLVKNPDHLCRGASVLRVSAINDSADEGRRLAALARQVLGKTDADEITVAEADGVIQALSLRPFNGDGIVPPDSAVDEEVKSLMVEILACIGGGIPDAGGKPGINQALLDRFFTEATAFETWWSKSESNSAVLPLGPATADAAAAVGAVKGKVEDFFTRGRLAAFDERALAGMNREEKDYLVLGTRDLSSSAVEAASFPLARVEPGGSLPLDTGVNPAWSGAISALKAKAVVPLLGEKSSLTQTDWAALLARLVPFVEWSAANPGFPVAKLGAVRVRQILASPLKQSISALIAQDQNEVARTHSAAALARLVRYNRDLVRLCHNFVSFRDFYGRKEKAIFQAGTLYVDQRSCDLCLTVEDPAKHAAMAGLAGVCLAYCDCARKGSGEKMQIVAAITNGDSDNLMAGRNGVFFDRKGRDWDATITRLVDNPISIRQAFFSPYKKLLRFIEEQVAKRASLAEAAEDAKLAEVAHATAVGEIPKPAPLPRPRFDTGTLAAIGLVLTTLVGALGGIFGHLIGLRWWQIPLVFLGLLLAVSGPSATIAYLKLRRRNLGPILDANGWAVNAKAKINVPFGESLTRLATMPPGSHRDLVDPFAEKKSPWPAVVIAGLLLVFAGLAANSMGYIFEWTGGRLGDRRPVAEGNGGTTNAPPVTAPAAPVSPAKP